MTPNDVTYRTSIIEILDILSHKVDKVDLQKSVDDLLFTYDPNDILCDFFDGLYHPKSIDFINEFTEDELIQIGIFSGFLQIAWDELNKSDCMITKVSDFPEWLSMVKRAKYLKTLLEGKIKEIQLNEANRVADKGCT